MEYENYYLTYVNVLKTLISKNKEFGICFFKATPIITEYIYKYKQSKEISMENYFSDLLDIVYDFKPDNPNTFKELYQEDVLDAYICIDCYIILNDLDEEVVLKNLEDKYFKE